MSGTAAHSWNGQQAVYLGHMSPELPSFVRQDGAPLYPRIIYNRPVTRSGAGRLLLVGGHSGEFSLPTTIYQLAMATGLGDCQVVLPDSLLKFIGGLPGTNFVASSPSGSLGTEALGRILELSEEMDAIAIGASLSNNSRTAILVERLIREVERPVILFGDALSALQHHAKTYTQNPDCLVILTSFFHVFIVFFKEPVNSYACFRTGDRLQFLKQIKNTFRR